MSSSKLSRLPAYYWIQFTANPPVYVPPVEIKAGDRPPYIASAASASRRSRAAAKAIFVSPGFESKDEADKWLKANPDWNKGAEVCQLFVADKSLPI